MLKNNLTRKDRQWHAEAMTREEQYAQQLFEDSVNRFLVEELGIEMELEELW